MQKSCLQKYRIFFILTFLKLFLNLTLFILFFKSNTFGRAYSHGAANSSCRAMHEGAAGVPTWQCPSPLVADVAGLTRRASWHGGAAPPIMARQG